MEQSPNNTYQAIALLKQFFLSESKNSDFSIVLKIGIVKVNLATLVEGDPKAPFSIATTPRYREGRYSIDPQLIMLSAKQGGIKNHFLSFWYDSTWDWTPVSRTIGEHSTH